MKETKIYAINDEILLLLSEHDDGVHYQFTFADAYVTSGNLEWSELLDNPKHTWSAARHLACEEIGLSINKCKLLGSIKKFE